MNPIIVIPARMAAMRLPGKPLMEIAGRPMICHVIDRALESGIGPVVVATEDARIAEAARTAGAGAAMTRVDHVSGSDRVFEAVEDVDPAGRHDVVINLQGDLPTLDPGLLAAALGPLADPEVDIATLAAVIVREEERASPTVVKVVGTPLHPAVAEPVRPGHAARARVRALYFSRAAIPSGDGPLLHHIGLYAYRREALARFVALPRGVLEARERLEQLRALEAGMRIDVVVVDTVPLGVDTPADLARARDILAGRRSGDGG